MTQNKIIENIFKEIEAIGDISQKNVVPRGARVLLAYKVFRALDRHRFRLEPADIEECLGDLVDTREFLENLLKENNFTESEKTQGVVKEPIEEAERMQYLYGLAWGEQSDQEYYHGASHFKDRLLNSNIDISFLESANCLDLGTGHARYALAMLHLGAKSVTGVDFSKYCLDETERRLKSHSKERSKIKLVHKDVYDLPKDMNNTFDFVCANSFIHHLSDPERALEIVYKTMKRGGHAFVFVFAEDNTPTWRAIDLMRELLKPVPIWHTHKTVKGFEVPGNKIFNFLDYSYTPIQHRFKRKKFEKTLKDIGFKDIKFLEGGVIHDSVLRSRMFEADKLLYGNSEIRYLLKK
ncbi:MAG: class I SAM-dependent methyltransferase [Candidatus Pacebacteria bacterium]|nr:class I SAM-dependent methyltransferase [Candidatus Paceibacterota bacterium]MDP6659717.1 class I SAM-dependent methyltransferase [Candidatus Paceibacterota bacterium]